MPNSQNADSGCGDIPRHSQSLRSPANVMGAGEAHPAALMLARVSCALNGTSTTVTRVIDAGLLGQGWSTTAGRCPQRRPLHFL